MSESMDPFAAYETGLGHEFMVLVDRVDRGYADLDRAAHADGSVHDILEFLNVIVHDADALRSIRIERSIHGWISVSTSDAEGTMLSYFSANYATEEPKQATPGKHRAAGLTQADTGAVPPALSQTEQLFLIAGLIEEANDFVAQGMGQIEVVNR